MINEEATRQRQPRPTAAPPARKHTCSVLLEKTAPDEVRAGREFEYEIRLTNLSPLTVESVVVLESLLSVLTIQECNPPSLLDGLHQARWSVGPLYPDATVSLRLRCVANRSMRFRSRTAVDYAHGF